MGKLKEQYREVLAFFAKDLKIPLLVAAAAMSLGILLGAVVGVLHPEVITKVMEQFTKMVEENGVVGADGTISMMGLLSNNWRAMLVTTACGIAPFLFLPAVSLVTNGFLLGLLGAMYGTGGLGLYMAGILPHGIFELSALLISAACGIALCRNMGLFVTSNAKRIPMVELLYDILRVILLVIAPLTVAAAAIEAYVTPVIMSFFL